MQIISKSHFIAAFGEAVKLLVDDAADITDFIHTNCHGISGITQLCRHDDPVICWEDDSSIFATHATHRLLAASVIINAGHRPLTEGFSSNNQLYIECDNAAVPHTFYTALHLAYQPDDGARLDSTQSSALHIFSELRMLRGLIAQRDDVLLHELQLINQNTNKRRRYVEEEY